MRLRRNSHPPVGSCTHHEGVYLRGRIDNLPQVREQQTVPLLPSPVGNNAVGKQDQILVISLTVNEDVTETVVLYAHLHSSS